MKEILIEKSPNGSHKVRFPYKHETGWRGFKSIGMFWQNMGSSYDVIWWIPPTCKMAEAIDFIDYWYNKNPMQGKDSYVPCIVEQGELVTA
jgi:hypothetical protein